MGAVSVPYVQAYVYAGNRVRFLYRDEQGRRQCHEHPVEFTAYVRRPDLTDDQYRLLRSARRFELEGAQFHTSDITAVVDQGAWIRLTFKSWESRKFWCGSRRGPFQIWDVPTFEADIGPGRRLIADRGFDVARPRRLYLDLETDSRLPFTRKEEMRILSWAIVDEDGKERLEILREDTDEAERELLLALWESLEPYDQILAWNGDRFDFPVLFARSKHCKIDYDERPYLWLDHLSLFKRMNSAKSGEEKQSMKLENVCQHELGYGKLDFDAKKTWEEWHAGGERRKRMGEYNLNDTRLLPALEKKTGLVDLFQSLCEACRVFPDSASLNPTLQVDGFMLRLGVENNIHFPSRLYEDQEEREKFKGAYVMEPKTEGITKSVHVGDFAGLYPNIIRTWNMSPETKRGRYARLEDVPAGCCWAPKTGIAFDTTTQGVLPMALETLAKLRKYWQDLQASLPPGTPEAHDAGRRSTAYKVAANSFYGVVGSPFSRYFDKEIAESVTQNGVWLIQQTMQAAEKAGSRVIYGDTDSIFIAGTTEEHFRTFVQWCNGELYPYLLKQHGCRENLISLAYEKEFERIVFVGAKKYTGRYEHYKGKRATDDSKPEVKGLEWRRGDAIKLARDLQWQAIDLLMLKRVEDAGIYQEMVTEWQEQILKGPLGLDDVMIVKTLRKELDDYSARTRNDGTPYTQPPQVQIAKLLKSRGEDVSEGTRIEFIMVATERGGPKPIPAEEFTGECDRYYLWESLIYPPTRRLLEAALPAEDWAKWQKVRPKRDRHCLAGQTAIDFQAPATRVAVEPPPAAVVQPAQATSTASATVPGRRRAGPFIVHLDARKHTRGTIEALKVLLAMHPGQRAAELHIATHGGDTAILSIPSVSVTPALVAELDRILAA